MVGRCAPDALGDEPKEFHESSDSPNVNRGVYSAAMGMNAAQRWMDISANNLANVSTDGFKADGIAFGDALVREMRTGGRDLGSLGSGPHEVKEFTDHSAGVIRKTGNPLDVALSDTRSMISVRDGDQTKFVRGGAFEMDAAGTLVTSSGAKVLDARGAPITLDRKSAVEIDPEGNVRQGGRTVAKLGVFEGEWTKEGNGMWTGSGIRASEATVSSGALEGSNVDALAGMVDLIKIGRHVEMAQRAVQSQDETTQKLLTVLSR